MSNRFVVGLATAYLTLLYTKPAFDLLGGPFSERIGTFMGLLLFAGVLIVGRGSVFSASKEIAYSLCFAFAMIVSGLFGRYEDFSTLTAPIYSLFASWAVYASFRYLGKSEIALRSLIWTLTVLAVLNGLVGIWGGVTGQSVNTGTVHEYGQWGYDDRTGRSGGLRGENYVGAWNAPAAAMGLSILVSSSRYGVGAPLLAVYVASIAASLSRSSAVCLLIAVMVSLVFLGVRKKGAARMIAILAAATLCVVTLTQINSLQSANFSKFAEDTQANRWQIATITHDSRLDLWRFYFREGLESPLIGRGFGFIQYQFSRAGVNVPHNSFLDVFVSFGLFGLVLYLIPFVLGLFQTVRILKSPLRWRHGPFLCIALLSMSAVHLTLSSPDFRLQWVVLGLLSGMVGGEMGSNPTNGPSGRKSPIPMQFRRGIAK